MFSGFENDSIGEDSMADFLGYLAQHQPSTSTAAIDENLAKVLSILKEKEKDLDLTARIGASLLEQNKELQERNDFLEESLSTSNETVTQLRHQLRQRSTLFHELAHLSEEEYEEGAYGKYQSDSFTNPSNSQCLHERVKALEAENSQLKAETNRLETLSSQIEERGHRRVRDYLAQLEKAGLKIFKLQSQLVERNRQCEDQAAEMERLMREISERCDHEEQLLESNVDLNVQLGDAIQNHEYLRGDIAKLQERYLEVMGMLQETEDELRVYRQRMAVVYRTNSVDSLYDSLASELEASDSGGCYNTPIFSARCESQHSAQTREQQPAMCLQLERLRQQSDCLPIREIRLASNSNPDAVVGDYSVVKLLRESGGTGDHLSDRLRESNNEPYDIPSKALVNAFKSCQLDEELKRQSRERSALISKSNSSRHSVCEFSADEDANNNNAASGFAAFDDENFAVENRCAERRFSTLSSTPYSSIGDAYDENSKDNTPIVEAMSFSTISCQSVNTVVPMNASIGSLNRAGLSTFKATKAERRKTSINNNSHANSIECDRPALSNDEEEWCEECYVINGRVCSNISCSPIAFQADFREQLHKADNLNTSATSTRQSNSQAKPKTLWRPKEAFLRSLSNDNAATSDEHSTKTSNNLDKSCEEKMKEGEKFCENKTGSLESISSSDSDYDRPKFGEPGKPGTRDLDRSLLRLKRLRNKIELDYAAFRRRRGLPPSLFGFGEFLTTQMISNSIVGENRPMFGCLSSQMNAMFSRCDNCANILSVSPNPGKFLQPRASPALGPRSPCDFVRNKQNSPQLKSICSVKPQQHFSSKFLCSKSKTINDIASVLTSVPDPEYNNTTIVRRMLLNEIPIRRRASSLSEDDSDVETDNRPSSFLRNGAGYASLRTSSLSPYPKRISTNNARVRLKHDNSGEKKIEDKMGGNLLASWLLSRSAWTALPMGGGGLRSKTSPIAGEMAAGLNLLMPEYLTEITAGLDDNSAGENANRLQRSDESGIVKRPSSNT